MENTSNYFAFRGIILPWSDVASVSLELERSDIKVIVRTYTGEKFIQKYYKLEDAVFVLDNYREQTPKLFQFSDAEKAKSAADLAYRTENFFKRPRVEDGHCSD